MQSPKPVLVMHSLTKRLQDKFSHYEPEQKMKHTFFKKPGPSPTPPCLSSLGLQLSLESVGNVPSRPPGLDCNSDTDETEDYSQGAPASGRAWGQEARAESVASMGATGG